MALPEKKASWKGSYSEDSDPCTVTIVQMRMKSRKKKTNMNSYSSYGSSYPQVVGSPLVVREVKKTLQVRHLHKIVEDHVRLLLDGALEDWQMKHQQNQDARRSSPPFILQFPYKDNIDLSVTGENWKKRLSDYDHQEVELIWNPSFYAQYLFRKNRGPISCFMDSATEEEKPAVEEGEDAEQGDGKIHLEDCLKLMTEEETLGEDNTWYCSQCKDHKQAHKQLALWSSPDVLVVHLKRFSYTRYNRDKVDDEVYFPLKGLDLSSYIRGESANESEPIYDLYAVTNHFGGYGGGHYTAFAVNDGQWVEFDDGATTAIDEAKVQSSSAYMLFYHRRGSSSGSGDVPVGLPSGGASGCDGEGGSIGGEAGEAGVVGNLSARPRENLGLESRGKQPAKAAAGEFGGIADLEEDLDDTAQDE